MKLIKSFALFALLSLSASASASSSESSSESLTVEVGTAAADEKLEKLEQEFIHFLESKHHESKLKSISKSMVPTLLNLRSEFVQWVVSFGKAYESMDEELERMIIWVKNHEFISTHNQQSPAPSYTVAHNHFSDMTNDEFQQLHSLGKYSLGTDVIKAAHQKNKQEAAMKRIQQGLEPHSHMQAEFRYLRQLAIIADADKEDLESQGWFDELFGNDDEDIDDTPTKEDDKPSDSNLPDSVDWVTAGAVTDVKNQESCGSCWAFSTTGSIEGAMFITHGELVSLSEQNLIDCDTKFEKGCDGGMMESAFVFDENSKGLCSESDYPYLQKSSTCRSNCTKVAGSVVSSYIDIDEGDKHGLLASLVLQPTSIAMAAGSINFQFYSSGVYSEPKCGKDGQVDHGVLAVGYGTDSDSGKSFFNIKNSWGSSWGENGYVRLDRSSKHKYGTCAILNIMTAPTVA